MENFKLFYSFYAHFNDFSHTFELRFRALKKRHVLRIYKAANGLILQPFQVLEVLFTSIGNVKLNAAHQSHSHTFFILWRAVKFTMYGSLCLIYLHQSEMYLEHCQTAKMELFAKTINSFRKKLHFRCSQGSEYVSGSTVIFSRNDMVKTTLREHK